MKTFIIKTLGCRVNQCESEAIEAQLMKAGYTRVASDAVADICVVNTCAVTNRACMQSRQLIRQLRRAHPGAELVATGCYAQVSPGDIEQLPDVDRIVDQDHKAALATMIRDGLSADHPSAGMPAVRDGFQATVPALNGRRKRPFVKIQDGCSAHCTYCIVPIARGPSRSISPEAALSQVMQLHRAGYREAVLTGIHLGWYGLDLEPPSCLLALLERIRRSSSIERVRLSSIEPCELTDDIISIVARAESGPGRFCRHFHIPLQSGDDAVLEKMNRPYTRDQFAARVNAVHHRMPDAAIGVDVLVGFPGESDAAFENTYKLLESLPISYMHVFPFSARRGTPACHMPDQLAPDIIKDRCRRIRALGNQKRSAFFQRFIGRKVEVLIERRSKTAAGMVSGTSGNYLPVTVRGGMENINILVDVVVDSADGKGVFGHVTG